MNMNRKIAIALIAAAAAAGNAFADDITIDTNTFASSRTRAEVQAELAQYKSSGVNPWSIAYNPLRSFRSTVTRAQVVGEYLAFRDQVAAMTGEDSGSSYLAFARAIPAPTSLAGQPHNAQ
jgi:vacuolar-type H+-ATPase catalytic subunit A/Vma1